MEELINITNYCDTVLVKYGNYIDECKATFFEKEDVLEFRVRYKKGLDIPFFQYQIANFNFSITDTEVLVNKSTINAINEYIYKVVSKSKEYVNI